MNIDWSKAPEGATHWQPENLLLHAAWIKEEDGIVYFWMPGAAHWTVYDRDMGDLGYLVPRPSAWTGEGLPPVGVVCENVFPGDIWREVIIIAHDGDTAVFRLNNSDRLNYFGDTEQNFRPIRTPEQIAAEDALIEIERLYGEGGPAAVYDAGYRRRSHDH